MGELKYIPFEEESENIKSRVADYWTERADSFFIQRQHELNSAKADNGIKDKPLSEAERNVLYGK